MTRMDYEKLNKIIDEEINKLKELKKTNPELAKKLATESLQRAGILDKDGKLAPPYNGKKVNEHDFTMEPKTYSKDNDDLER